jgi:thioredoxin-like negative regulator of GroEL
MDRAGRRILPGLTALLALWLAARSAPAIEFATSLETARTQGDAAKPVVVTFSAPWCGWCRKMSTTTFPDPQVAAVADQYLWVKLDADEEPALAARFRVHGLPHTLLLDADDRVLGSQPGYMTPAALVQFLEESLKNPQPLDGVPQPLLDALADLGKAEDPAASVKAAVELMAKQDAEGRLEVADAIATAGTQATPHLVGLLSDERLAVRAAAGYTLQKVTRADLAFDPFAAAEVREKQVASWIAWAQKQPSAPESR